MKSRKAMAKKKKSGRPEPDNRVRGAVRLKLVCKGLEQGKPQRAIARELRWDEGTIRRDIEILHLPQADSEAIVNGEFAEPCLRKARSEKAEKKKQIRLATAAEEKQILLAAAADEKQSRSEEEQATACHSDALAKVLLNWLTTKALAAAYEEQILNMAARANWNNDDTLGAPCPDPAKVLAQTERACGKMPGYMIDRIDYFVRVLVSALPLLAPEREIRDSALNKAIRAVENPNRHPRALLPWGVVRVYNVASRRV